MTKDFRNVGRIPQPEVKDNSPAANHAAPPPASQRVIATVLYATATGFFLAGLWLLSGRPSPIPKEVAHFVGIAFVIASVADVVAVQVLRRVWMKNSSRSM